MRRFAITLAVLSVAASVSAQNRNYPPDLPGVKAEVYRTIAGTELKLYVFNPPGDKPTDKRPAVVFFFGGGWQSGSPTQFAEQSRYLAERGMVAICADYRVSSRQKVTPVDCVEDAKAAVAYVRANASRLGIDPDRIAAGGGSAGGHVAACTGIIEGLDPTDAKASSKPNSLVLFNPAVQLAPFEGDPEVGADVIARIDVRTGGRAKDISPAHHVGENEPPTLILHGMDDTTVPFATVHRFGEEMRQHGNRCEVVGFKGQRHGFFNARRGDDAMQKATTRLMDEFFVSLGWLQGESEEPATVAEDQLVREGFGPTHEKAVAK